jgi:hypothetical protein
LRFPLEQVRNTQSRRKYPLSRKGGANLSEEIVPV